MYDIFSILLRYKEPSLPCGAFTTTAPADVKFLWGVPTPTMLEVLPQPEAWGDTWLQKEELL